MTQHETFIPEESPSTPWNLFIILFIALGLMGWVGLEVTRVFNESARWVEGK